MINKKYIDDALDQLEDEGYGAEGKRGLSMLDAGDSGKTIGGAASGNESPADPDGSNDDDPVVQPAEQTQGPKGENSGEGSPGDEDDNAGAEESHADVDANASGNLEAMVQSLTDEQKGKLRALLDAC